MCFFPQRLFSETTWSRVRVLVHAEKRDMRGEVLSLLSGKKIKLSPNGSFTHLIDESMMILSWIFLFIESCIRYLVGEYLA